MRRWHLAGAATLAVLYGVHAAGADRAAWAPWPFVQSGHGAEPSPGSQSDRSAAPRPPGTPLPDASAGLTPPPDASAAVVVRVIDGDTVVLRVGGRRQRVRLIGVDAPETWAHHDCFGVAATRALRRLAPIGATLRLAGDREPHDRYGRRLAYLWTAHGRFIAAELIRAGFARAMVVPPDTRYAAVLRAVEAMARRSGAGLWGRCP